MLFVLVSVLNLAFVWSRRVVSQVAGNLHDSPVILHTVALSRVRPGMQHVDLDNEVWNFARTCIDVLSRYCFLLPSLNRVPD